MAVVYAILSPFAGVIASKMNAEKLIMVVGCILISISYCILGPAPYFNMGKASLTSIIVSMVVLGAGLAIAIVPSMSDMITEAKISGMPDDLSTDALVGGYFNAIVF